MAARAAMLIANFEEAVATVYALHHCDLLARPAPLSITWFMDYVPERARVLPEYIVFHDVATATAITNASEELCYDFMAHSESRDAPYTLFFLLACRGLGGYICKLYMQGVVRISDLYDLYVSGQLDRTLVDAGKLDPADAGEFEHLAETIVTLYAKYGGELLEIE